MALDKDKFLNEILAAMDQFEYIKLDDIPNIDLYMDQVTTFMDRRLRIMSRYPEEDKVMTKTMINNYAKNALLPSPEKKKYSKEHLLLLIFIYYYKGILSIGDIQTLLDPITHRFFHNDKGYGLDKIYEEVFEDAREQRRHLKDDINEKFDLANESFTDAPEEDKELLQMFSFICQLSVDVYLKKQIIERLIDQFAKESTKTNQGRKVKTKKESSKRENAKRDGVAKANSTGAEKINEKK